MGGDGKLGTLKYRKAQKNRLKMFIAERISPNRSYTRAGLNSLKCHPKTNRASVVTYACTPFACRCAKHSHLPRVLVKEPNALRQLL